MIHKFLLHIIHIYQSTNKAFIHKIIHKAQFGNIKFCQVKMFLFARLSRWAERVNLHVVPEITRGGE